MATPRPLDFVIVGAQKAGTTTLFELMKTWNSIYIPEVKEAPFFSHPAEFRRGYDWYLREYFSRASDSKTWGTVSPQYMSFAGTAARLREYCPDVRIVALLRDPVERAVSHHDMCVRRRTETRDVNLALSEQLGLESLESARWSREETDTYVVRGEYWRVLSDYRAYFDDEQLLVLFTEDLESDPEMLLGRIAAFIGVSAELNDSVGARYNTGHSRPRFTRARNFASACPGVRSVWRRCVPVRVRARIALSGWQVRKVGEEKIDRLSALEPEVVAELRSHYLDGERLLEDFVGTKLPWLTDPERD